MSIVDGLHVPVIPLPEMVGKEGTPAPAQTVSEVPNVKEGVIFGFTVTENAAVVAHCPASGVKVYVAEFWLSTTEGLQDPVIPFVDEVGKVGTVPPAQTVTVVPNVKAGVMLGATVTEKVTGGAQVPAAGVNVYVFEF